jgi:hypothetical protein
LTHIKFHSFDIAPGKNICPEKVVWMFGQFQITTAQLAVPLGKAVEDYRSPRRCARRDDFPKTRSVLDCSSPLELCGVNQSAPMISRFMTRPRVE